MAWKIVLVISLVNYVLSERGAISEQRVVIHQLKSDHNDNLSSVTAKKSENREEEEYALSYPSYEFSYKVKDLETHDIKGQHEKRHGDEVKGLYWLIEPNGHKRTVNYQANDNSGFNAQVDYSAKKQYIEYGNKEIVNTYEVVEIIDGEDESNIKNNENNNGESEQKINNDQQNIDFTTSVNEEASLDESKTNDADNVETQGNIGNNNDNERELSDNDENQSNENDSNENVNSDNSENDAQSSTKVSKRSRGENKSNNAKYNNRNKNRAIENENRKSIEINKVNEENIRKRNNRNNRKQDNMQQNRKLGNKNKNRNKVQGNQKEVSLSLGDNKNLKTDNNKIAETNNQEFSIVSNNADNKNINFEPHTKDNKNEIYEHSIRIYHPKPITTKTEESLRKHYNNVS